MARPASLAPSARLVPTSAPGRRATRRRAPAPCADRGTHLRQPAAARADCWLHAPPSVVPSTWHYRRSGGTMAHAGPNGALLGSAGVGQRVQHDDPRSPTDDGLVHGLGCLLPYDIRHRTSPPGTRSSGAIAPGRFTRCTFRRRRLASPLFSPTPPRFGINVSVTSVMRLFLGLLVLLLFPVIKTTVALFVMLVS